MRLLAIPFAVLALMACNASEPTDSATPWLDVGEGDAGDGHTADDQPCELFVLEDRFEGRCTVTSSSSETPFGNGWSLSVASTSADWLFQLERSHFRRGDGMEQELTETALMRVADGARWYGRVGTTYPGGPESQEGSVDITISFFGEVTQDGIRIDEWARLRGAVAATLLADPVWDPAVPYIERLRVGLQF